MSAHKMANETLKKKTLFLHICQVVFPDFSLLHFLAKGNICLEQQCSIYDSCFFFLNVSLAGLFWSLRRIH